MSEAVETKPAVATFPKETTGQPPVCKRPRLEDEEQELKVAGFSLSAIEEMRQTRDNELQSEPMDQQLRQFQVLDEVGYASDEADDSDASDKYAGEDGEDEEEPADGEGEEYDSSEFDDEEIENLLDEKLPDELRDSKRPKYEQRFKTVLEEKRLNHFEVLPEGWVQVTHNSGMPLFLHRKTRVCSASRPYFLGTGSARKHAVPLGAIPCLNYRRALEEETEAEQRKPTEESAAPVGVCPITGATATEAAPAKVMDGKENVAEDVDMKPDGLTAHMPAAKIVTVNENTQKESITPDQLNSYCQKLFKFKVIRVLRFRSWNARRKFIKNRKHIKNIQRPTLPDGTKLIKFPILAASGDGGAMNPRGRKEWIMNPNGKSFVCILHEYVQHALKTQPTYEFKELQNAATPYSATVSVNNLKYGTGYGTSKKQAKSEAARETLEILIPDVKDKITGNKDQKSGSAKKAQSDLSVFDDIRIEDPRVTEFCNKTTEPSPNAILLTCLQRNYGSDVQISQEINRTPNNKNEFTMTVGKHTAKVVCKNKREGKQLASQAILQILHPHIMTWGSLLRLYGNNSIKTFKEKKLEEQEITVLQSKAAVNQPNYAILDKLKCEMLKLCAKQESVLTKGTFVPPSDVDLPTSSGSNLNNVEL
ncbi:microprocessor complex subunit DGCR8 isoform X1 [Drosophila kikkawai]|uniref:Microprocessor complex subunit DGCR8 isoform X1 n=1 Tax=Drosophila kikkawai TaxID=30033 RepID=A0A6P4J7K2_DROKI|nr:microprocessor complex subunit DGCR8 isoform X1 [Drosophila kikkawai]XP_017036885.1 microprocessor complex subunit DGCR8 isoform X1 [Drosophila kikkawai]